MNRQRVLGWIAFCAVWLALSASALAADEEHPPGWYLPAGVNLGMSLDGDEVGLLLGSDLSAVYLEGTWWYGAIIDGLYDFRDDTTRLGLGVELGWFIFGIDASAVMSLGEGDPVWGGRVRALLTASVITLYGGWLHSFDTLDADLGELGVLLKWPFDP